MSDIRSIIGHKIVAVDVEYDEGWDADDLSSITLDDGRVIELWGRADSVFFFIDEGE